MNDKVITITKSYGYSSNCQLCRTLKKEAMRIVTPKVKIGSNTTPTYDVCEEHLIKMYEDFKSSLNDFFELHKQNLECEKSRILKIQEEIIEKND